jgi:hypothetical protein
MQMQRTKYAAEFKSEAAKPVLDKVQPEIELAESVAREMPSKR